MVDGTNMLGLIVFALALGITLGQMKEEGKPLILLFTTTGKAILNIMSLLTW